MNVVKKILVFLLAAVLVLGSTAGYVFWKIDKDVDTTPETLNPDAEPKAIIVYHPGLTGFQTRVTKAFATGLAESGWRVEIYTAGQTTPTSLDEYSLVALGSPTYGGAPAGSLGRYLERVGDLDGLNAVVIATGSSSPATEAMESMVTGYGGVVVESLGLNTEFGGVNPGDPMEIARESGAFINP